MWTPMLLVTSLLWVALASTHASLSKVQLSNGQDCPALGGIEHGQVEHLVHYRCDPYYRLRSRGDGLYRCHQRGAWVNDAAGEEPPVCEPVCGKPANPALPMQRIIGGTMAAKDSFPWQARLLSHHNHTAGATLLSDQWLLTTGHNLFLGHSANASLEGIAPTLRLLLGRGSPAGPVERIVLHPQFPGAMDLALLKLKHKVPIGEAVMPICLAQQDYAQVGRVGYVSGWGLNALLEQPLHLKYVMLPVAASNSCQEYYRAHVPQPLLNNHTFCVGMSRWREAPCLGDAGGAFAVHDPEDDTWYAAGILSFDRSCLATKYGVYVRVLSVLDWIKETTGIQ